MTAPARRRVLLVGWDAADWEHIHPLLDAGELPTLEALINRGVMGNLATLQPVLSPMLWNSVATGKLADQHGILGFIEPDPVSGGARPFASTSRRCKALWNILSQSGLRSHVVGWWASHPAEPIRGTVVTNAFGGACLDPARGWTVPPGAVHPPELGPRLAPFKIQPAELTEAHILPFIPDAARIDQRTDRRLEAFAKTLADAASIHAVATTLLETEPWDFAAIYYDAVDHFCHAFMPYHPPRLPWISEADFALYSGVVRGAYRFHDMMLERLLQLAGPDATVILCSDHGFESGARRPPGNPREPDGPAAWHRQHGILVLAGPGLRSDERIYGASLLDLAPTVLTLFGLPVGADMDGRPLLEAWAKPPRIETIPTWESVPGDAGCHPPGTLPDRAQADEMMRQFAALGYIEDHGADQAKHADAADLEGKWNLARLLLWRNRAPEALPLLEELVRRRPWEDRFLGRLAGACFQAGHLAQAERVLDAMDGENGENGEPELPGVHLLRSGIAMARNDFPRGLRHLLAAEAMQPDHPLVCVQLGNAWSRLRRWDRAKAAYARALAADPDSALALQGLAAVHCRRGEWAAAADAALRAVGLLHRLPLAHFLLGVSLARSGEPRRAVVAFETALRFQPDLAAAHRHLAVLWRERDPAKAKAHRQAAAPRHRAPRPPANDRADRTCDLPPIPPRAERRAILLRERPDPPPPALPSGKTFVIVSGLPRSGTSLMMQMLQAGGVPILTDHERAPDADNPRGYLEWEPLKRIAREPHLLDDVPDASALKCVAPLLPHLPPQHSYRVIFLLRPVEQIARSQAAMIQRRGTAGAALDPASLRRGLAMHRDEARAWLRTAPHVESIEVDYPALVADPAATVTRLVEFLGPSRPPHAAAMAAVVDPALHRRRN